MSDRTNRFSRHHGENIGHVSESDLFADLIDTPGNLPGSESIPPEVMALIETTNLLRRLDLPPARPSFRAALRASLIKRLASIPQPESFGDILRTQWQGLSRLFSKRASQLAMAGLAALIVALVSSGTAYASQSALPGDALYGVKTGIESVQLALASDEEDVSLQLAFLDRRVAEIEALVEKGRYDDLALAVSSFSVDFSTAAGQPDSDALTAASSNAINALTKVLNQVPQSARPTIAIVLKKISERQNPSTNIPNGLSTETPGKPADETPGNQPSENPGGRPDENPGNKPTQKPKDTP